MIMHGKSLGRPWLCLFIGTWLLVFTARADNQQTPPSTDDPEAYEHGKADAQRELAQGVLAYETFGLPQPDFSEFRQVLLERYKIEVRAIAGCLIDSKILGHSSGFNQIMEAEIVRRYGKDVWDRAEAEAQQLFQQKHPSE
jgi:hypothetical protein